MSTIIDTPAGESDSGLGLITGLVIAVVAVVAFFLYGLPAIRNMSQEQPSTTSINVQMPAVTTPVAEPQK